MPRNLLDNDRKKNQFGKDERLRILTIMKQYAPLLDKSASTMVRKEIWMAIEDEFKEAGFTGKTSAQLKKYWQNYKYHSKKANSSGKDLDDAASTKESKIILDNEKRSSSLPKDHVKTISPTEGGVLVKNCPAMKFSEISKILRQFHYDSRNTGIRSDPRFWDDSSRRQLNVPIASDLSIDLTMMKEEKDDDKLMLIDSDAEPENQLSEGSNLEEDNQEGNRISVIEEHEDAMTSSMIDNTSRKQVIVSDAQISDNSVTVSVIYPENKTCVSSVRDSLKRKMESNNTPDDAAIDSASKIFRKNHERTVTKSNTNDSTRENWEIEGSKNGKENQDASGSYVTMKNLEYRSEFKHKLVLHQLEAEEKRLKVKIAEMAIQEMQLRIKALNEDMRRTEELYRLSLTLAVSGRNFNPNNLWYKF